eukprot:347408-Rhodomonas_salina.1
METRSRVQGPPRTCRSFADLNLVAFRTNIKPRKGMQPPAERARTYCAYHRVLLPVCAVSTSVLPAHTHSHGHSLGRRRNSNFFIL